MKPFQWQLKSNGIKNLNGFVLVLYELKFIQLYLLDVHIQKMNMHEHSIFDYVHSLWSSDEDIGRKYYQYNVI